MIIELLIVQSAYLDYIEPKNLFPKTDGMEKVIELQKKSDSPIPYRVASIWHRGPEGINAAAPYRMLEYYGLEQAGGYSSLYSKYYKEFVNAVEHPDNLDNLNTHHPAAINFERFDSKLSNYLSIKYVLTAPEVEIEELNNFLIYEGDDLWIYENKNVLPRVFLSSNAVPYNSAREVFEKLLEPDFDPHKTVLVDNEYFQQINNQSNIGQGMELPLNDAINVTKYSSNETELIIHSTNEKFLVLLDNNIPGWQCFINGRKVKIGRAYNTFQTVKIMPGISNVHFKYTPPNLKEGIILSSVGFVIFFILFGAITLKSRKRIVHH